MALGVTDTCFFGNPQNFQRLTNHVKNPASGKVINPVVFLQCPTIEQILWSSHSKTFEHREIMEDEAPSHWLRATHELVRFNIHQKPYSYFMLFHVTHSIP